MYSFTPEPMLATTPSVSDPALQKLKYKYSAVLWIRIRIQELCGSGSVFPLLIRIYTCKYWIKFWQRVYNLRHKFTIQRLN